MYGMSFNTTVGNASVFGELAYRPNLPIGIAATNDLLGDLLLQSPNLASGRLVNIGGQQVQLGDQIHNYTRVEAFNTSLGTIYNFGPSLASIRCSVLPNWLPSTCVATACSTTRATALATTPVVVTAPTSPATTATTRSTRTPTATPWYSPVPGTTSTLA